MSEANLLGISPNSYIVCQPYCQNGSTTSRVVHDCSNPLYNFYQVRNRHFTTIVMLTKPNLSLQKIPLVYDDNLLLKFRENYTLLEFWEKCNQSQKVFGLAHLPLHQFYLAYRNETILNHLKRNKVSYNHTFIKMW